MEKVRLQKLIANRGYCSRRKAEQLVLDGKVRVNDKLITELGYLADIDAKIEIDSQILEEKKNDDFIYLAFNKPIDVVSTLCDPQKRKTVKAFIPRKYSRLYPVGRLDYKSKGLMIFTNDGQFANLITHPSSAPEKEYIVKVIGIVTENELEKIKAGVYIKEDGYTTAECMATILKIENNTTILSIILHEGKKREIRNMMQTLNHHVVQLMRIRIGNILLGSLKEGQSVEIDKNDIEQLIKECKIRKGRICIE